MFVIEVIPLIKSSALDTLSYFSSTEYAVGTFLKVPIRKKLQPAVVTAVHNVASAKNKLRDAAFTLIKLPPQGEVSTVPENIRKTATALLSQYPVTLGALLYELLPPEIKSGVYKYPNISSHIQQEETTPRVLTATYQDRFITYRSHIRSILAKRGSVLFVVPSSSEVESAYHLLAHGIEDRMVQFSPTQSAKERTQAYTAFEDTTIAKVIITTSSHAYLDRVDLLSFIVEGEGSDSYVGRRRPYLDHRTALAAYAKVTGRSIIFGDTLPRPEIEAKRRTDTYSTEGEETKRLAFAAPLTYLEQKPRLSGDERAYSMFSQALKDRILATLATRGRVFLYGARRGISPMVTCVDCGHIFRCPDSQVPYSLLRTSTKEGAEQRWFIATTSGKRLKAPDTCPTCGSWRLRERGIGIQAVYDECLNSFPQHETILFDHLTASTAKKAKALISDFYSKRGIIMVGTQMALPYLRPGVDISGVVSLDATRANPTWRTDENILRLLLTLRELSLKEVVVQGRQPEDQLLSCAKSGTLEGFYTEELALRQALSYPPLTTFILLSWQGTKPAVAIIEGEILARTGTYAGNYYSNPLSTAAKTLRHCLFRLPSESKEAQELIALLRTFPPYIKIEVNPNRIV